MGLPPQFTSTGKRSNIRDEHREEWSEATREFQASRTVATGQKSGQIDNRPRTTLCLRHQHNLAKGTGFQNLDVTGGGLGQRHFGSDNGAERSIFQTR